MSSKTVRIGILTPSSNTVLEPVTAAIVAPLENVTVHFSRFPVTQIALSDAALSQFDMEPMLAAARLLADARVNAIAWSGTSASWLGFDRDKALCAAIQAETGISACTSVLALNALIDRHPGRRLGLVSPYTADVQERIKANYAASGYQVVADARLDITDNFAFAEVTADQVAELCRKVASVKPDCMVVMCTNMRGAIVAPAIEAELGIPVYDSAAAVVRQALTDTGVAAAGLSAWGSLFHGKEAPA